MLEVNERNREFDLLNFRSLKQMARPKRANHYKSVGIVVMQVLYISYIYISFGS